MQTGVGHFYRSHELTYGGELIKCGHCGYSLFTWKKGRRQIIPR